MASRLLNLIIVIAILGTLIAFALLNYQNYTFRANVAEALTPAALAKLAFSETR